MSGRFTVSELRQKHTSSLGLGGSQRASSPNMKKIQHIFNEKPN